MKSTADVGVYADRKVVLISQRIAKEKTKGDKRVCQEQSPGPSFLKAAKLNFTQLEINLWFFLNSLDPKKNLEFPRRCLGLAEESPSLIWNRPSQSPSGFLLLFLAGHMILAADQPPCPVDRFIFRNASGTKNVLNLFLELWDWSLFALFPHHRCAPPTLSLPV
ncbi:hypothetical protein YC2023_008951 [Brassica napus]